MDLVNLIIFILFMAMLGLFVYDSVRLRIVNKRLFSEVVQAEIDKAAITEKLNKAVLEHSAEKTDGFLRFVSESRDQAFKYIESVQEAIAAFNNEIGPIVKHYKQTGKALNRKPLETLKKLNDAYDIIMTLAPDEDKHV